MLRIKLLRSVDLDIACDGLDGDWVVLAGLKSEWLPLKAPGRELESALCGCRCPRATFLTQCWRELLRAVFHSCPYQGKASNGLVSQAPEHRHLLQICLSRLRQLIWSSRGHDLSKLYSGSERAFHDPCKCCICFPCETEDPFSYLFPCTNSIHCSWCLVALCFPYKLSISCREPPTPIYWSILTVKFLPK